MFKIQRSISNQECKNNNKTVHDNITTCHDSGYTSMKTMLINGKHEKYTEDRNINFSFDKYHVIGATDGHGGSYRMSVLVSGSFQIYFTENVKTLPDMESALLKTFDDIHKLSMTKKGISGTTLTVCVIDKEAKRAYTANLGDSVTQIFRRENDTFKSVFRTIDHDAGNIDEQRRLESLFGNNVSFNYSNFTNSGSIYAKINGQEIMVVAGIGDFHFPDGFIRRIPDISSFDLQTDDIIICSSDGFYETYNTKEQMLCSGRDEQEIIKDLNELFKLNKIYGSPSLAHDLMEKHVKHIANILKVPYATKIIKANRDNNTIITFLVK